MHHWNSCIRKSINTNPPIRNAAASYLTLAIRDKRGEKEEEEEEEVEAAEEEERVRHRQRVRRATHLSLTVTMNIVSSPRYCSGCLVFHSRFNLLRSIPSRSDGSLSWVSINRRLSASTRMSLAFSITLQRSWASASLGTRLGSCLLASAATDLHAISTGSCM